MNVPEGLRYPHVWPRYLRNALPEAQGLRAGARPGPACAMSRPGPRAAILAASDGQAPGFSAARNAEPADGLLARPQAFVLSAGGRIRQSVRAKIKRTNASVKRMAGGKDPVAEIQRRIQERILGAVDEGRARPPYDPARLAETMGISVVPNQDVPDARLVPRHGCPSRIEFNPNRPRGRIRFSIAREIAHTMFPDHAEAARNRSRRARRTGGEGARRA